jgi:hypothetical protein
MFWNLISVSKHIRAFILVLHPHRKFTDIKLIIAVFTAWRSIKPDLSKHWEDRNTYVLAFAFEESNEKHRNCGLILPESTPGDYLRSSLMFLCSHF